VFTGAPLFFALEHLRLLPPALRDRPWPFALMAIMALIHLAYIFFAVRRGKMAMHLPEKVCAIANAASIIALIVCVQFDNLPTSPSVLPIGVHAPRITLLDQDGKAVNVSVPGEPVLFVVFRGVWCPYCRTELARLAREVPRFAQTNVHVYGISGDPPDALLRGKERQQLPFSLLSDPERKLSHLCDFSMHCLLLFDGDGTLRWGGLNESWRSPPRYESILQAAYRLTP